MPTNGETLLCPRCQRRSQESSYAVVAEPEIPPAPFMPPLMPGLPREMPQPGDMPSPPPSVPPLPLAGPGSPSSVVSPPPSVTPVYPPPYSRAGYPGTGYPPQPGGPIPPVYMPGRGPNDIPSTPPVRANPWVGLGCLGMFMLMGLMTRGCGSSQATEDDGGEPVANSNSTHIYRPMNLPSPPPPFVHRQGGIQSALQNPEILAAWNRAQIAQRAGSAEWVRSGGTADLRPYAMQIDRARMEIQSVFQRLQSYEQAMPDDATKINAMVQSLAHQHDALMQSSATVPSSPPAPSPESNGQTPPVNLPLPPQRVANSRLPMCPPCCRQLGKMATLPQCR